MGGSTQSELPGVAGSERARSLEELREAAAGCKDCRLWKTGTQTVFGDGLQRAEVMMVGEQPGDREDIEGRPFVGPAGRLLDEALELAGIDRSAVYVTNVVKHFKWKPRGKRRIHQKPSAEEIAACRQWLDGELEAVRPRVLVALGATAAQALFGRTFRVSRQRGQVIESPLAPVAMATVHPSSILRAPDEAARREAMGEFVDDLLEVAAHLDGRARPAGERR
jgi:uracil-DNA glycosylase family protein